MGLVVPARCVPGEDNQISNLKIGRDRTKIDSLARLRRRILPFVRRTVVNMKGPNCNRPKTLTTYWDVFSHLAPPPHHSVPGVVRCLRARDPAQLSQNKFFFE